MRAVNFVEKLDFEFTGNLFERALALGDVDNDKNNELVVGNLNGDLAIFKGTKTKPWRKASDLGMITSFLIGDVMNNGKNVLLVISGEGWCHILQVNGDQVSPIQEESDKIPTFNVEKQDDENNIIILHRQRIFSNTKSAILADIDGDGCTELVIALTDRVVRVYCWLDIPKSPVSPLSEYESGVSGKFVALNKWELAAQMGSISLNTNPDGTTDLIAAQPGGTYVSLICPLNPLTEASDTEGKQPTLSLKYHPLASGKASNLNISTEIIGNIREVEKKSQSKDDHQTLCALCTLDGTLTLVKDDCILWSLQVDHQLFSLNKLDITEDGNEEVIACSWDGQTYIFDHKRRSVCFQFEENVCAFTAGEYSLSPGQNTKCLIFATFNNRISVYYNIHLPQICTTSLTQAMNRRSQVTELLNGLQIDVTNSSQLQALYQWCLYGLPFKS